MDRELVEQAQRGDTEAYDALARAVAPGLYRAAHRIMRDLDSAQDATQQALVAMWREIPRLRDPDRFEAWTYQLVVRYCLMELRSRRRRLTVVRNLRSDESTGSLEPSRTDDSRAIADRDELERAFRLLTEEQRAVVVLRHYVGLSVAESADALGVPVGTAASRLHYATRALRAAIEAKRLRLELDVPAGTGLRVNRAALQLTLANLLRNAVAYTDRGEIRVRYADGVLAVSDTGIGIAPAELPRVFERAFRGANARAGGTGIGLAIVRRVAERFGWRIDADSTPGEGTTFRVRLAGA
jgi:RNA polymerase sigma factor (sigma-70 family)